MSRICAPPLAFLPVAVERPWGGSLAQRIVDLPAQPDGPPIGEWWLLSTRPEHPTRVAEGPHDGRTLAELMAEMPEALVGARHADRWRARFPLLVKLLDAREPLSVQVHPAERDRPGEGKTESWYILEARDPARFFLGLAANRSAAEFFERFAAGVKPPELLAEHVARRGVVAHLPPGLIHALGGGIVCLEVQTNADTTYRIWDWDREPRRPLHLDDARRVSRPDQHPELVTPRPLSPAQPPRDLLVDCEEYSFERIRLHAPSHFATDGERFEVLVPLDGGARLRTEQGATRVPRGHAALVPAESADYVVSPERPIELLRIVPKPRAA